MLRARVSKTINFSFSSSGSSGSRIGLSSNVKFSISGSWSEIHFDKSNQESLSKNREPLTDEAGTKVTYGLKLPIRCCKSSNPGSTIS